MLGHDIAAALPELRAHAESLMVDTCLITTPGAHTWDDATGIYLPGDPVVIYEGKCRLRNANPAPQNADAGEAAWAVDLVVLSLPVATSTGVRDGHDVEITASAYDPAAVGLLLKVQAGHIQTNSTARRIPCQVVSRDA